MANKLIKSKRRASVARPDKIDVEFTRDGQPWIDTFQPTSVADAAALSRAMNAARHPDKALDGMLTFIRKALANDDGVPASWTPERYVEPEPEPQPEAGYQPTDMVTGYLDADLAAEARKAREKAAELMAEEDEAERRFTGPDGEPYAWDELDRFTKYEAGSSRRRWSELMDNEDDLVVDAEVISGVFEHLVGLAAARPTRRPS